MEEKDLREHFWKCSKAHKTQRIILKARELHLQARIFDEVCFSSPDDSLQSTRNANSESINGGEKLHL